MPLLPGVYTAKKTDGTLYYRTSLTYRNKHISLGSFPTESSAHNAYLEGITLINDASISLDQYRGRKHVLSFHKWVVIVNFRDNGIYIKNPVYLKHHYFVYYLDEHTQLKFDVDDLFYYSTHKIMKRGGHLFVADYGMQVSILSRYGIHSFSVAGKDYIFGNGDDTDYRYGNIEIINRYQGVRRELINGLYQYVTKIHIVGDVIVGRYSTEIEAAVAYNKAANLLNSRGLRKNYTLNYIDELDEIGYVSLYHKVRISNTIREY
ncbi:MAG TPA: hypothetical protein VHP81_14025 [Lachnospiraceae bacterium]|nr:hypothetical protein [Lachnospiraceae bacterium]